MSPAGTAGGACSAPSIPISSAPSATSTPGSRVGAVVPGAAPRPVPIPAPFGSARGGAILGDLVEVGVLLTSVGPVLELDDPELLEPAAQPASRGVEQAQLLAVGHDLAEQQLLEHVLLGRDRQQRGHDRPRVDAHALPHLLL